MAKKETVNIKIQTIYTIIPFLWLLAFYRVEKLTLGFAISLFFTIVGWAINDILGSSELSEFPRNDGADYTYFIAVVIHIVVYYVVFVFLIRRWSLKWNNKITDNNI